MLDEHLLIGFARDCLTPLLGSTPEGWFFLAGGAFKSLLHGRPPRDLDLWPATDTDRHLLRQRLVRLGAQEHEDNPPFQTRYTHAPHFIELAYDTSPRSLEERLARFDIALSAVGVEHREGHWRAVVHPLAHESIRHREVRLLTPLVNWKYALATLERLRRYAVELEYALPPEEEQQVWSVFDAQSAEGRGAMIERYLRVGHGNPRLVEEARCRPSPCT